MSRFEGRHVAVTGAGGFIGAAVARALMAEGATVAGLDASPMAAGTVEDIGASFVAADICDAAALDACFAGADLVVHTAARVDDSDDMAEFVRVNVSGTAAVMDAAERAGSKRVVHLSSVVVYGYEDPSQQDESATLRTYGIPYLDTKSSSDRLARARGAVVIRPGDVYGPGSVPWVVRPLGLAWQGQLAYPSATALMLPVYVDDLVESILLAALEGEQGQAYAAWSGERVTFAEYFQALCEAVGAPAPRRLPRQLLEASAGVIELLDKARGRTPRLSPRAILFTTRVGSVSNRRAVEELGWTPQVEVGEGIDRAVRTGN